MRILLLLMMSVQIGLAGEVKYPVRREDALKITAVSDKLVGAPTIVVQSIKKSHEDDTYSVKFSGNKLGTATIEFCFESPSLYTGDSRQLPAGQAVISDPSGELEFTAHKTVKGSKGWFVRMVNSGTLVAWAASSPKFEELAKDPATVIAYGQR